MTDVLPKLRVNDPHTKDADPLERQSTTKLAAKTEGTSHPLRTLASETDARYADTHHCRLVDEWQNHRKVTKSHVADNTIERFAYNPQWRRGGYRAI
jgi:hypothetical protein